PAALTNKVIQFIGNISADHSVALLRVRHLDNVPLLEFKATVAVLRTVNPGEELIRRHLLCCPDRHDGPSHSSATVPPRAPRLRATALCRLPGLRNNLQGRRSRSGCR